MWKKLLLAALVTAGGAAQEVPRFALPENPLHLKRATHGGVFLNVAGPRSAIFGLENGPLEGWIYPLKVFQDMELAFRLEGYPVDIQGRDIARGIEMRPEYTVLTYSHSAFTARQILFCPRSTQALVSLLDLDSSLPMTVTCAFRPRLRLMWPGALPTPYASWDESRQFYKLSEDSGAFTAFIGSPGARDTSNMPYQEEPKDSLLRMEIPVPLERSRGQYVPIVAARSAADYSQTLQKLPALLDEVARHYQQKSRQWVQLQLPDRRLQQAYDWSLIGMDKGVVHNPLFAGPGLVAGFRTSGESERPGFAWFFGRDSMWTGMATLASGDREVTRQALDFLVRQQRADGKIPHEISQSAPLVDWFKKYSFAWASSDATPLFLIVHGELFEGLGDREYLARHWPALKKAWAWTAATDTDGDGLKENTGFGHAWVEGGALYPPHQEIYLQGVFMEAARRMAVMARAMGDEGLAQEAEQQGERVRQATEKTFWMPARGHYAFGTAKPMNKEAEPGPNRLRRQQRLNALAKGGLVDEDTVLPAVPMMWSGLSAANSQLQLDHLNSASLSTDWGARLLSEQSLLYDPLAYHYGSVWPLFTGWLALAGYRHGRPQVGWQALASNAALTEFDTLGYVTELLSGDYCSAFGRSSHHQVWSEAMVALPLLRGLLGLEVDEGGRRVNFAPQPPADWDGFSVRQLPTAAGPVQLEFSRRDGQRRVAWKGPAGLQYRFTLSFPLDAQVAGAQRLGETLRVTQQRSEASGELTVSCQEGCELILPMPTLVNGQRSSGLRLLRQEPAPGGLRLVLEGRAGQTYQLGLRGRRLASASAPAGSVEGGEDRLTVRFAPPGGEYRRLEVTVPYAP